MILNNNNFRNYHTYPILQESASFKAEKSHNPMSTCYTVYYSSSNYNKLGFSSQFLYKVNIKQLDEEGREKLIPAKVTRLIQDDPEDIEAMKSIGKSWTKAPLGKRITRIFTNKNKDY